MKRFNQVLVFILNIFLISTSHAAVKLTGTRIIFNEGETDKTIYFQNSDEKPSLVQVWFDKGDEKSTLETGITAFVANPQIFRLDAGTTQSVRLKFTESASVPQDIESLYYLNFMEFPMTKESQLENNQLAFVFKNRIKILYRPKNLQGNISESVNNLVFKLEKNSGKNYLNIENPSNFYVNLNDLIVEDGNKKVQFNIKPIPPKSSIKLESNTNINLSNASQIKFSIVNDFGAVVQHQAKLN